MAILGDTKAVSLTLLDGVIGNLNPKTTGIYDLGTSSLKWNNIYGTFKGNADTATTLAASKTLWGQSFNGSANVSGSMTNVGPMMKLPSGSTAFGFYTSGGGAANITAGRLGLNSNFSNADLTNYVLDVSGKTRIKLPNNTSSSKDFTIVDSSSYTLSIGGQGIQAYGTNGTSVSALNLQYYGGNIQIGTSSTASATRDFYGMFDFKTTGGFNYSGIETSTSNGSRNVWFSYLGTVGRPVVNDNFKYNPSESVLTLGKLTITGGSTNSTISSSGSLTINATTLHGTLATSDLSGTIANSQLANSSITIGASSVSLGGILNAITGPISIKTSGDKTKAFIINRSGSGEATSFWQDDAILHIDMVNDETAAQIKFELKATDTEGSDGSRAQTSYITFNGANSKSTITADYFSGNGSSLTNLNGSNITSGTIAAARIDSAIARLASPALTGTPTAPTAANGTSTTQIATTAFVNNTLAYINSMQFKGTIGTGGTITALPATHNAGDTYRVITAGTYAGKYCEVGTLIICVKDGTTAADADWTSVETNEDGSVIGPTSSITGQIPIFSSNTGRVITNSEVKIDDNNNITTTGSYLETAAGRFQQIDLLPGGSWSNYTDNAWYRCCKITPKHGSYVNFIIQFGGIWFTGAPTIATVSVQTLNTTITLLHCSRVGFIKAIRLVNNEGIWLDVQLSAQSSGAMGKPSATFIGNVVISDIATAATITTDTTTPMATLTFRTTVDQPTFTLQDNDGTNSTTSTFTHADQTLKLPSTIKASLTGNASTATEFNTAASIALTGDTTGSASSTKGWSIATTTKYLTGTKYDSDNNTALTTHPGGGKINYAYNIRNTTGLFDIVSGYSSNSILTLSRHDLDPYVSQLGFSSNSNIYYRSFNGSALDTTTAWKQLAFIDSNVASATKVGTAAMWLYSENNNEINFGGNNAGNNSIYFGYRAKDSKTIPTKFIFGGSTGTADLQAKTVYLGSGTTSYISSTQYTGNAASANTAKHVSAAHWSTTAGAVSGVIKIKIKKKTSWMLAFTVRVYQGYNYDDYVISGYNYGSSNWYNPDATLISSESTGKHTVTFGYDDDAVDGYKTLWISIPKSASTGIDVFNVTNGFTQIDIYDAFEIVYESTSTGTIQKTVDCYRPWYRNETVSAAETATNLSAKPVFASSGNNITVTAGGKTSDAFTVPYATSANNAVSATSAKALANINGTYGVTISTNTTTDRVTDANITHLANGGIVHFKIVSAANGPTTTTSNNSGNILHFHWDAGAWDSQLFVPHSTTNSMAYRASSTAGTWGTWRTILDSNNYTSYAYALDGSNTGSKLQISTQSAGYTNGIQFMNSTTKKGSIGADNNGTVGIYGSQKVVLRPQINDATIGLEVTTTAAYPTTSMALGTSSNKWSTIYGTTFDGAILKLHQGTAADPSLSGNARIEFDYSSGQPVVISYTPNDSYRNPAGLKIMGGTSATPAWLEVEGNVYATEFNGNLNGNATTAASLTNFIISKYTIAAGKGVRIKYPSSAPVLISCQRSNFSGRLILIGGGYGEQGTSRNDFTELVSPAESNFIWSMPEPTGYACSIEIMNVQTSGNATIWVESTAACTFTEITALTSTKTNRKLLHSSNYTDYTVTKTGSGASGSWGISITGSSASCTGNAATATAIQTAGTTAQFYRGDNSWSNILKQTAAAALGIDSNAKIGTAIKDLHFSLGSGSGTDINSGNAGGITFGTNTASYGGIYWQTSGNYGSRIHFATTGSFANGAYTRMIITSDGKVGIGTLSPDTLLTVNGNAKATKFIGALQGNADTATSATTASKLSNTSAIGATDRPVYFTANGVPAQTTYRMAGTNAIATTGITYSGNLDTGIWYVNGIATADNPVTPGNTTDGAMYVNKYSDSWIHEIYGDHRTGQIAVRGKNNGTWQAWRKILDDTNYSSYALPLSGGQMTGPLTWKNSDALPEKTSADYFLAIDAFANGGKTYWISKANVLSSIGAAAANHDHTGYLKWQTSSAASTALYDFGVYRAAGEAAGTGPNNSNYYNIINVPYRKASGNTKLDWGWQLGNATANDNRMYYRTTGDNIAGDWQTIAHATTSTNNIGSTTQPVYMTSTGVITACTAYADASVNYATTAGKISDISSSDAASSTATWRRVWFSYNDNVTGRPSYSDNFAYQTSTGTLKTTQQLIGSSVLLQYNSTDQSLDFVFV